MKHRPDIDGLRAVAVVAVIMYHAKCGCPGGYVGVDIFFVISGYFICSILEKEIGEGQFSFRAFWERRIRRLLPALFMVLLVTLVLGWLTLSPVDYRELGLTVTAQPLLGTNLVFWRTVKAGYFADLPETRPTLHTWSLAVEEQFYLLCPLFFMLVFRRLGARWIPRACALVGLVSLALSGWLTPIKPVLSYFLLPTRAFEILLGGLTRYFPRPARRWHADLVSWCGLGCISYSISCYSDATVFPGWAALLPCLGSSLLLAAGQGQVSGLWQKALALPGLAFIGLISYSLYLWHWPLIAFWLYVGLPWEPPQRIGVVLLSFVAATISYQFVEKPFRLRRLLASQAAIFRAALSAALICLMLGLGVFLSGGFPARWSPTELRFFAAREDASKSEHLSLEEMRKGNFTHLGRAGVDSPRIFLWGDSHALAMLTALDELCSELGVVGEASAMTGTPPFLCTLRSNKKLDFAALEERSSLVRKHLQERPPDLLILVARWDAYTAADYKAGLEDLWLFLQSHHIPTRVLLQVPRQRCDVPRVLAALEHQHWDLSTYGVSKSDYEMDTGPFVACLDQVGWPVELRLDPTPYFLNSRGLYGGIRDGVPLYYDNNHVSVQGSRLLTPLFRPLLQELKNRKQAREADSEGHAFCSMNSRRQHQ